MRLDEISSFVYNIIITIKFLKKTPSNIIWFITPSNTTSSMFFYVYVLESLKDKNRYIGYTNNLKRRLEEHKKGLSFSTKYRLPFKLIYFEGCINEEDAKRRERYLKTTQGRRFLGLRLLEYGRLKNKALGISGS